MKNLCGRSHCPLLLKAQAFANLEGKIRDREVVGDSPSVFVGRYGYPRVNVGPLTGPDAHELSDAPDHWYGMPLEKIVEFRTSLFRGKEALRVDSAMDPSRGLQVVQEIAMSKKPVGTDLVFRKRPALGVSFSMVSPPFGPSGTTESVQLQDTPKIPRKVDAVVGDELKAAEGMTLLYEKRIGVNEISKILSVGLMGMKKKLVPTRWSITATDDTLGKRLLQKIRTHSELDDYLLFRSDYLDNHFHILLVPGKWSFEMIETYTPGCIWVGAHEEAVFTKDYEAFKGRTKYADSVTGGYYAARLAVAEYLTKIKRQAGVFVLREIGEGYYVPVGVWEVRENCRAAMVSRPMKLKGLDEALAELRTRLSRGDAWEKQSTLLPRIRSRDVLRQYMT